MNSKVDGGDQFVSRISIPFPGSNAPQITTPADMHLIPRVHAERASHGKTETVARAESHENKLDSGDAVVKYRSSPTRPTTLLTVNNPVLQSKRPRSWRAGSSEHSSFQHVQRVHSTTVGARNSESEQYSPSSNYPVHHHHRSLLYASDQELVKEATKLLDKFHQRKQHQISTRAKAWARASGAYEESRRLTSGSLTSQHDFFGSFESDDQPDSGNRMSQDPARRVSIGVFQKWDEMKEPKANDQRSRPQSRSSSPNKGQGKGKCRGSSKACKLLRAVYKTFGLSHVLLLAILMVYAVIGAFIFLYLEGPAEAAGIEQAKADAISRHDSYTAMIIMLMENNCTAFNSSGCANATIDTPAAFQDNSTAENETCEQLLKSILRQYDNETGLTDRERPPQPPLYSWDFLNAMFFAATLFTTIGYGNISAKTFYGRIATIIYASLGIPLMLTVLNDLGKLIFVWARHGWNCVRRLIRFHIILPWRHRHESPEKRMERMTSNTTNETGTDVDQNFPLPLALLIVFVYTFLCATIFMMWERNWDYFTGFYFFFISLSTIGLGDVLPDNPHFTTATFGLFIVGLALVSMCINVMQAKVEARYLAALELIEEAYQDDETEADGATTAGFDDEGGNQQKLGESSNSSTMGGTVGNTGGTMGSSFEDDESHGASLGIMQIYRRPSRGSSKHSSRDIESPTSPKSAKLKVIAERDENTTKL